MNSAKLVLLIFPFLMLWVSCESGPKAADTPPPEPEPALTAPAAAVEPPVVERPPAFDPTTISREVFNSTKEDVQRFIEDLNRIIRNKNYAAWKDSLAPALFTEISSAGYLARISESDAMKSRKIVLKTPEDYFTHVVVPSRASSRVDDIEFIAENRVKAFTVAPNGQRLRLYDLEKSGSTWKIIN